MMFFLWSKLTIVVGLSSTRKVLLRHSLTSALQPPNNTALLLEILERLKTAEGAGLPVTCKFFSHLPAI